MKHSQIAAMKPAVGKGFFGCRRVFVVALHHRIPADKHLANGLTVSRNRFHGFRIGDHESFHHWIGNSLPRLQLCLLFQWEVIPFFVPGAHHTWPIDLSQSIDMRYFDALLRHSREHRCRWRRGGGHHLNLLRIIAPLLCLGAKDELHDDWRTAEVGDPLVGKGVIDGLGFNLPQTNMGSPEGGDGPGKAPAVAVKHR